MRFAFALSLMTFLLPLSLQAQTLERIKETGEIRLGYRTDAAPLSFENDAGQPQGYSPIVCYAVVEYLAEQLEMEKIDIQFVRVTTEERFDKIANDEIDLLCGAASITLERRKTVDFSLPTYVDGATVMLQNDAPNSLEELAGQKIGVRGGTTTEAALRNTLADEGIAAEVVTFGTHADAMAAMEADEIAGYFADQSILMNLYLQSADRSQYKIFDQILTLEQHGLALRRGDNDFRLAVDTALSEMYRNGSMEQAFSKALPGVQPGGALAALFLLAPINP
jgi:polar amino acid transport system substrate-binding protein/glutamate/aspartate transport system substrate-binding protein